MTARSDKAGRSPPGIEKPCEDDGECMGAKLGLPLRSGMGFTTVEEVTLDCLRLVAWSYASGESPAWDKALEFAERHFGTQHGHLVAVRLCGLMRALRVERQTGFTFLSAHCRHICNDELAVMSLIKAARQGRDATLQEICRYVTGHSLAQRTIAAAEWLAAAQLEAIPRGETSKLVTEGAGVGRGALH
jgi:hypothetical protein